MSQSMKFINTISVKTINRIAARKACRSMKWAVVAVAVALAVAACTKQPLEPIDPIEQGEMIPINISLGVEDAQAQSKGRLVRYFPNSPEGTVSEIGLFFGTPTPYVTGGSNMLLHDTEVSSPNRGYTIKYKYNIANAEFFDQLAISKNDAVTLTAYYPRVVGATERSVPFDLTTTAQKNDQSDALYLPPIMVTDQNASSLTLEFKHVYTSFTFMVKKKWSRESKITRIDVLNKAGKTNIKNKGIFSALDGTVSATTTGTVTIMVDSLLTTDNYALFHVMFPPFTNTSYADGDIELQFYDNGVATPTKVPIKKAYLTDGTTMSAGYYYMLMMLYDNAATGQIEVLSWDADIKNTTSLGDNTSWVLDIPTNSTKIDLYSSYYGLMMDGTNGYYYPYEYSLDSELPYYKLEVAPTDFDPRLTWLEMRSSKYMGDYCRYMMGSTWRMPRASEMTHVLLSVGQGSPITDGYWSASEVDANSAWYLEMGQRAKYPKAGMTYGRLRCVRSIPSPPTLMVYKGINGGTTNSIDRSTNLRTYETVFGEGVATNLMSHDFVNDAYDYEPVFERLEVDKTDLFNADKLSWTEMRSIALHEGDVCRYKKGGNWRMPRMSELKLMQNNRIVINASGEGFDPLKPKMYWSATEKSATQAWCADMSSAAVQPTSKEFKVYPLRCVRNVYVR